MVLDFTKETIEKPKIKRYFRPTGKIALVQFTNKEVIDWEILRKKLGFEMIDRHYITY